MSTHPRNHDDLPILEELGRDLGAAFRREERAEAARGHRRRLRRLALATGALFVVVPSSVVATRYIWAPDPGELAPSRPFDSSRPIRVAQGGDGVLQWRISAYASATGVCHEVTLFTATQSGSRSGETCSESSAGDAGLRLHSVTGFGRTLIDGWLSPRVARVEVQATGQPRRDAQIVTTPPEVAERGRLPEDLRFYVATFPGEDVIGARSGVRAIAFDDAGRVVGRDEVGNFAGAPSR